MAIWEIEEKDGGKTIIIHKKTSPPVPYKNFKTWLGQIFVWFMIVLAIAVALGYGG